MKIEGDGERICVYIGESDRWHGRPLYEQIVRRAREEGLAGATVLRGMEGFGATSRIHAARLLSLSRPSMHPSRSRPRLPGGGDPIRRRARSRSPAST